MALSDRRILEEMGKRNIVIEPFNPKRLSTSSYDVTLGEFFFREQQPQPGHTLFNIYDKEEIGRVWGKLEEAFPARDYLSQIPGEGIGADDRIILLRSGETILAHTQEFIGGRNIITTMMKAKSSMGRVFIEVCKCAGWGDVGFTSRWTMEITNNSQHYTIPLVVGRPIAQIVFFETGPIRGADYTATGKYQTSSDIEEIKRGWTPEMMLPRLWKEANNSSSQTKTPAIK